MITETIVQSCCGSKVKILNLSRPVKKHHVQFFKDAGYLVPQHFLDSNIFYIQQNYLIATCALGSSKLKINCNGKKCDESIQELKNLLEKIL